MIDEEQYDEQDDEQDNSKERFVDKKAKQTYEQSGYNTSSDSTQQLSAGFVRFEELFLCKRYGEAYRQLTIIASLASASLTPKENNKIKEQRKADAEIMWVSERTTSWRDKQDSKQLYIKQKRWIKMKSPEDRVLEYNTLIRTAMQRHGLLIPTKSSTTSQYSEKEIVGGEEITI